MSIYNVALDYNCVIRKKGSLNTYFNSERNFADVSTRCSSLLQGESGITDYRITMGLPWDYGGGCTRLQGSVQPLVNNSMLHC